MVQRVPELKNRVGRKQGAKGGKIQARKWDDRVREDTGSRKNKRSVGYVKGDRKHGNMFQRTVVEQGEEVHEMSTGVDRNGFGKKRGERLVKKGGKIKG